MNAHLFRHFFAIASITFREIIRQTIVLLLYSSTILFCTLLPLFVTHRLGDSSRLIRDSSLALYFVGGLVLASWTAGRSLHRELQSGTAATVLTKPVGRSLFFTAKFTGVACAQALYSISLSFLVMLISEAGKTAFAVDWHLLLPLLAGIPAAFLLAGLQNYISRKPFSSCACFWLFMLLGGVFLYAAFSKWFFLPEQHAVWELVPVLILIGFGIFMLTSIAMLFAVFFDSAATFFLCFALFFTGLISDYLIARHIGESIWPLLFYNILPNWQNFWLVDALSYPGTIPWAYVATAGLYAAGYSTVVLGMALLMFSRTDLS